jgi:3-deoxy-D-manno-octulosonate 8-phosphate phosphatase (KDO 8-P phosphatase)
MKKNWQKIKCLAVDVDGVLTDGAIYLSDSGEWRRNFYIRDGLGLLHLREKGYKVAFITSTDSQDIKARAANLKIDHFYDGIKNKADAFRDLVRASGCKADEIAYVGDDVIDLPIFELCGISIAPNDAHAQVLSKARHITKACGGRGAVREICDLILSKGPL